MIIKIELSVEFDEHKLKDAYGDKFIPDKKLEEYIKNHLEFKFNFTNMNVRYLESSIFE